MWQIVLILLLFLTSNLVEAKKIAVLMGGSSLAEWDNDLFLWRMEQSSHRLTNRGWDVKILFGNKNTDIDGWKRFPANSRGVAPGSPASWMSPDNYNKQIDSIISNGVGPSDSIEIQMNAHGATVLGKHFSAWQLWQDNPAYNYTTAMILTLVKPTVGILGPKIEDLLKTGAKVHLDIYSCYSGEVLDDMSELVKKYKGQLCITAGTTGDGVQDERGDFYSFIPENPHSRVSVLDQFYTSKNPDAQISSLPSFQKFIENSLAPDKEFYQIKCSDIMNSSLPNQFLQTYSSIVLKIGDGQKNIEMKKLSKLDRLCTKDYQQKLLITVNHKLSELKNKFNFSISVPQNEENLHFALFMSDCLPSDDVCDWNKEELTKKGYPTTYSFFDIASLLDSKINYEYAKMAKRKLFSLINLDPNTSNAFQQFMKEWKEIKDFVDVESCDKNKVNQLKILLRQNLLLEEKQKNLNSPDTLDSKLSKACSSFYY